MNPQLSSRQLLDTLRPLDYVESLRIGGRSRLDQAFVECWAERHRVADRLLRAGDVGAGELEALRLFRELTYPMVMHEVSPIPSYYPYTGVHLLDWFMAPVAQDLEAGKRQSLLLIAALLLEVGRFEMHSLIGRERFQTARFLPELAHQRFDGLREVSGAAAQLAALLPGASLELPRAPSRLESVEDFAVGAGRLAAVVELSCLPQTEVHDEVLFLRAIQLSECCFYGIRLTVSQAMAALEQGAMEGASLALEQALGFADVLRQVFLLLRTMPPEHFHDFRAAAANASAVQSASFQWLDIQLFGMSEKKVEHFRRIPHLRHLLAALNPPPPTLRGALAQLLATGRREETAPVLSVARELDRKLLGWRGLHVAFAVEYLAETPVGTGGTSGAPYLKQFLHDTLFAETRAEVALEDELEAGSAPWQRATFRMTPPAELIGPNSIVESVGGAYADEVRPPSKTESEQAMESNNESTTPTPQWWEDQGGFFGRKYIEGDDSLEGFLSTPQTLGLRTEREVDGIVSLLGLAPGATVLDCPCGYGRHSIALARRGLEVVGSDINQEMLAVAEQQANGTGNLRFARENMISLRYRGEYDAVINMFLAFGFFEGEGENLQVLENFRAALRPGGSFLLHTDVNVSRLVSGTYRLRETRSLKSGRKLEIVESYDRDRKRLNGQWILIGADGAREELPAYSCRIYTAEELATLCRWAGFDSVSFFGGWDGRELSDESEEMIVVASRAR